MVGFLIFTKEETVTSKLPTLYANLCIDWVFIEPASA